jgi:hypothetical protein
LKKGTIAFLVLCCITAIFELGCGGGSSSSQTSSSKLAKRAFVTNSSADTLQVIDAAKDQFTAFSIPLGLGTSRPTLTQLGANDTTLVFTAGDNGITIIDNKTEQVTTGPITLPGGTESLAETSDGKTIFAAVRSTSQVVAVDTAAGTATAITTPVPLVSRVVLSHNNSKLLAFSDGRDTLAVINTADNTVTTVSGFDRPFFGVFSSDDSKAYILSCGGECGGTAAKVTILNIADNSLGASLPVPSATMGLIDNNNLFVAGSTGVGTGTLQVINLSSFTPSGAPIQIGDGFHNLMALASSNKLFIGARTCTTGCLSIVDVSASTAVVDAPFGAVSGIAPIAGRNVVYVTEGSELRIYDTTTSKLQPAQLNIIGPATGVVSPQ